MYCKNIYREYLKKTTVNSFVRKSDLTDMANIEVNRVKNHGEIWY